MGSKVGQQITSWVYIDGGAAATVAYAVYDENGDLFASGNMTHKGGARFYADWTPDAIGVWTILITCSLPAYSAILQYHVGMGQEADILTNLAIVDGYVSGIKGGGWTTETLKAIFDAIPGGGGGGIFSKKFYIDRYDKAAGIIQNTWYDVFEDEDIELLTWNFIQDNDEVAAKDIGIRVTVDTEIWTDTLAAIQSGGAGNRYVYLNFPVVDDYPTTLPLSVSGLYVPFSVLGQNLEADSERSDIIISGHAVKLEFRVTSVPGTNQRFRSHFWHHKMEVT